MAEIVLFHHALGRTEGVIAFADLLRADGHQVHTPDPFDGRTFTRIEDGVAYAQEIGFGEVIARGVRVAVDLPADLVASTSQAELFLYPGDQHLCTDASLDAYDADATARMLRRVLELLADR